MDQQKTGLLIASLRKEKNLTQKELADKLGITDRAVSKWERGLGYPDVSLLADLSKVFDISVLELLKGERLDKDAIVNDESLIASMHYSQKVFKNKMKEYFNLLTFVFIIIISLLLLFFNGKSIYYFNKKYYNNVEGLEINLLSKVEENIEIISRNQGNYSDEDYEKIFDHVTKIKEHLNYQRDLNYLRKKTYTYDEMVAFYHYHEKYINYELFSHNGKLIYEILHQYDPHVVHNMIGYVNYINSLASSHYQLFERLTAPYFHNKKIENYTVASIVYNIYSKYKNNNILLEDIIKVGDMYEN